jgi:hypothetical protein
MRGRKTLQFFDSQSLAKAGYLTLPGLWQQPKRIMTGIIIKYLKGNV